MDHVFSVVSEKAPMTLTGVTQGLGHHPANEKAAGLAPHQGTCLGFGPDPWLGVCKGQLIDVSLVHQCFCLSPSLPLSLK